MCRANLRRIICCYSIDEDTRPKMKVKPDSPVSMMDPSQLFRPEEVYNGKPLDAFRDYSVDDEDPIKARVRRTYYDMHTNMTVDFVKSKMEKWLKFNHFKSTIKEALIKLNDLVDESDPDTDLPNIVHAFQTAERIREDHPDDDWFHLIGLIHDLGKVMAFYDEPQWCVVGDTFPVGCKWGKSIVYGDDSFKDNPDTYNPKYNCVWWRYIPDAVIKVGQVHPVWLCVMCDPFPMGYKWGKSIVYGDDSFKDNHDTYNPKYNTVNGIYKPKCGIDNLMMSWGHDEYLYRVLIHNKAKFPKRGLYMIRYHSFYPWHAGGDYKHLITEEDDEIKEAVLEFNKYDLYTKSAGVPDIEALWPYYEGLIEKYIPGVLEW